MYFASTFRPELVYYHREVAPKLKEKAEELIEEAGEEQADKQRGKTEEAFDLGAGDKGEASTSDQPGSGDDQSPEDHKKGLSLVEFRLVKESTNLLSKTLTIFIF